MKNQTVLAICAVSVVAVLFSGYGNLSAGGQVSQESMARLRTEKVRFDVPQGEIVLMQGQPSFISLCRAAALPGVPVSLTNPTRGNSMMGAGVCGMTNMPGSTDNPTGGNPPYHFDTEFSFTPFGLTLNGTTGFISGRPTQPGRFHFKVCAYDASGNKSKCEDMRIRVIKKEEKKNKKNDAKDQKSADQDAAEGEPFNATPSLDKWGHAGSPMTKILVASAAGVGGGLGALYASDYISKQIDSGGSGGSSPSSSGSSGTGSSGGMTYGGGASFNCTYNAGGVVNSCAGSTITVNITVPMSVGSSLKLSTNHIQSNVTTTTKANPPGSVTFQGFSGGGWTTGCGSPVTRLDLFNVSASSSVVVASVSGLSLPVTCR
jgi:hypothetical protein